MILRTFKEEGIPQDLIYLAQAESGFRPVALSRVGARGMWQFMAAAGGNYGLKRTWWADDRQDPIKATRAAARFLKDLYKQFGDWYLVMAAYNSGAGTVQRAVQRTGYADFWELHRRGVLPAETRNYVPIILAITIISKNPSQYGLDRLRPDPPLNSETVTINYPVDLRLVAECVDSSVGVLQDLNPSLLRLTTPKDQEFALHLPAGTKEKYHTAIAAIPEDMRVWWHYHRVHSGDTLGSIAKKYHTTAEAIQKVNDLKGDDLRLESKLIIPSTPGRQSNNGDTVSYSKRATRYKVHKGDTVLSVADAFSVPAESVRKWNHLKGNTLKAGRSLTIYRAVKEASSDSQESASRSKKKGSDDDEETASVKTSRGRLKRAASHSKKADADDEETSASSRHNSGKKAAKHGKKAEREEEEPEVSSKHGKARHESSARSRKSESTKEKASARSKKQREEAEEEPAPRKRTTKGKGTSVRTAKESKASKTRKAADSEEPARRATKKKTASSSASGRTTKHSKHAAR
jgi:membrane-bound lytic murein transglycosylase D